jgi:hypothetical protein
MKKILLNQCFLLALYGLSLRAQTLVVDTFYYTGSTQTFVIPQCVSNLTVVMYGAEGGEDTIRSGYGKGQGARLYVVMSPTPGTLLNLNVGGSGHTYYGGWNGGGNGGWGAWSPGGGGGGSSDIRIGNNALSNRIFVAGGGGGSGGGTVGFGMFGSYHNTGAWGGEGGSNACSNSVTPNTSFPACPPTLGCGGGSGSTLGSGPSPGPSYGSCNGATVTGAGAGGGGGGMNSGGGVSTHTNGCPGTVGTFWQGGSGGDSTCTSIYINKGHFGGGGGGGGYYGGGGGHASGYVANSSYPITGGGGGGSSYLNSSFVLTYSLYGGFVAGIPTTNPYTGAEGGVITISYFTNGPEVIASASQNSVCAGQSLTLTAGGVNSYTWLPVGSFSGSNSASVSVNPTISTQYTVSGINAFSCKSQTIVNVQVDPLPIVQVSPAFPAICPGDSVKLTASGATWYSWSTSQTSNGIMVSPGSSIVYTVTGSSTGTNMACAATKSVQVVVYPVSPLNVVASPSAICLGESATLNAGGAISYTWNSAGNAPLVNYGNMVVSPSVTTTYSVTGASINSCKTKNSIGLVVEVCTSLNEQHNDAMKVFPNPSEGTFYVHAPVNATLCIYASTGQIVLTETLEAFETKELKLDNSGIYYILAQTPNTVVHFKLEVVH